MERASEPREARVPVAADLRLHVLEWGPPDGWPVVLLHGGSHSARCWQEVCPGLPGMRCIVPDQRGHGESDWSPTGDYSCAAQVEDLDRLLEALGIVRFALVGHSMGGLNALLYAGTRPERVAALVLVDVGTETREAGLERVQQVRRPHADRLTSAAARALMQRRYPHRDPAWRERQLRRELRQVDRDTWQVRSDPRLLRFVPTYCGDTSERRRLLVAAGAPLLVVRGAHSRILSRQAAAFTARLGNGHMAEIPGAGHNVPLDNPAALAEVLRRFLEPLRRRTP